MPNKPRDAQIIADVTFTTPVAAIGEAEFDFVYHAMADIAPAWSVEMAGICPDEATLVLLPEGGDDAIGPGFMISRETYGFRLDQLHWDVMTELGVFASLTDVTTMLGVRLAPSSGLVAPPSVSVH